MPTSKRKSAKPKATKKSASRSRKAAKSKAAGKSTKRTSSAKTEATAAPAELHPRLREQSLRSERSTFPKNFHALYDRGFRVSRGITPLTARAAQAGSRRLAKAVQGVEVQYDDATQLPNLVLSRQPTTQLSSRSVASPEGAVMDFIKERSDLWNLTPADTETIETLSLSRPRARARTEARTTRGPRARGAAPELDLENLKTVNMIQRVEGKEVFNSDVTAAVNADNQALSIAGQFFPGAGKPATRTRAATMAQTSTTSAEEAIARAAFDLTNLPYEASEFERSNETADSGPYRFYDYKPKQNSDRPTFSRPVRVKDVMFPLGAGQFTPAYYLELWIKGFPAYSYVMDALDTPELLYRKTLTSHVAFKYRVHNTNDALLRPHDGPAPGTPHPAGKPNGFQATPIAEKLITVESLLPGDPWLPPTATTTDGNNCIAYADLKAPDGFGPGDVMGKVSAPLTFDYRYQHTKSARDPKNLQNSLVGMFFHVNWLHDRWYEAGFDEASGNAQKNNFGRGGIGGDPILAEGNDFSGHDNANMSTPADGDSPIMQMYEFTGPSPKPSRTSNHEALITFHEMGHYITNR